jgi:hypothetical protein
MTGSTESSGPALSISRLGQSMFESHKSIIKQPITTKFKLIFIRERSAIIYDTDNKKWNLYYDNNEITNIKNTNIDPYISFLYQYFTNPANKIIPQFESFP